MVKRLSGLRPPILLAGLVFPALLAGCAGDGPAFVDQPTWFEQIQREVFDQSCLGAACHSSGTRAGNLSLAPGESYDQLVGIEPTNPAARSAGFLLVAPFAVGESFLVNKINGDLEGPEGALMPLGAPALPESEIQMIADWIAAGASPTDPAPVD